MQVTLVILPIGTGFWRLNKYAYGCDFQRLTKKEAAHLIAGTVKNAGQIRFKLDDGTIGITDWNNTGMPIEYMPEIFEIA